MNGSGRGGFAHLAALARALAWSGERAGGMCAWVEEAAMQRGASVWLESRRGACMQVCIRRHACRMGWRGSGCAGPAAALLVHRLAHPHTPDSRSSANFWLSACCWCVVVACRTTLCTHRGAFSHAMPTECHPDFGGWERQVNGQACHVHMLAGKCRSSVLLRAYTSGGLVLCQTP